MKHFRLYVMAALALALMLCAAGAQAGSFSTDIEGAVMTATGSGTVTASNVAEWLGKLEGNTQVTKLEILNKSDSQTVTAVDKNAFDYFNSTDTARINALSRLTEITIPDTVERIGEFAFRGCSFTAFEMPSSLKTIITGAFAYCKKLTEISIPYGVTAIPGECFTDCTSLVSVTLPNSVTKVGENAFDKCSKLKTVRFRGTQAQWNSVEINANGNTYLLRATFQFATNPCGDQAEWQVIGSSLVITGSGEMWSGMTQPAAWKQATYIAVDEGITVIGSGVFEGLDQVTSVVLPDSLLEIGAAAFNECVRLSQINFPAGLEYIGANAFSLCSSLKEISFSNGLGSIGMYAFVGCTGLTTVSLPGSLYYIGDGVFSGCTALRDVSISEGLVMIGNWAFMGCDSLRQIHLPASLRYVGAGAFNLCAVLTQVTVASGNPYVRVQNGMILDGGGTNLCSVLKTASGSLTIPGTVTGIDNTAFDGCTNLTKVTFPDSWTPETDSYDPYTLSLADIFFPAGVIAVCTPNSTADDYFTILGHGKIQYQGSCDLLEIPAGTEEIDEEAFEETQFVRAVIPEGVTAIPSRAFADMPYLSRVVIPASVTSVAADAFAGTGPLIAVIRRGAPAYLYSEVLSAQGIYTYYIYDYSASE